VNPTIEKFGYPASLVREFDHWVVLLRPAQATLGALVLAAKSDATAFSDLSAEAFEELHGVIAAIERGLAAFRPFERINYLMLMMVDRQVHFHVLPRYSGMQEWGGADFPDKGWPGPPQLGEAIALDDAQIGQLASELAQKLNYFAVP
jgi:diadenosine tetraphosphate (Ap4A) HIT family hydrolase